MNISPGNVEAPPVGNSSAPPVSDSSATAPVADASGGFPKWLVWIIVVVVVCLFIYLIWLFAFRKVATISAPAPAPASAVAKLSQVPISGSGLAAAPQPPPVAKVPNLIGCYVDKEDRAMPVWVHGQNPNVYVSFDKCKQDAIAGGWKYYALQNGSIVNGQYVGVCFASNDPVASQRYGKSGDCTPIPGTDKHSGNGYTNYIYGVDDIEPTGTEHTMPTTVTPVGCYNDPGWQSMPDWVFGNTNRGFQDCQIGAAYKGLKYFGLQNVGADGKGVCFGTSDDTSPTQFGASTNCQVLPGSDKQGGKGGTNYVYKQS